MEADGWWGKRLLAVALGLLVFLLPTRAHAMPTDQTWIPGFAANEPLAPLVSRSRTLSRGPPRS